MVFKYIPDRHGIGDASFDAILDAKIEGLAQKVLEKAQELARAKGLTAYESSLHIEEGQRPKGRGYRRVVADTADAAALEWGDNETERLRILGQASGVKIFPDIS